MQICSLLQNNLLRGVTYELAMKRKHVLEATLLPLDFTFMNYFSDVDIEVFDRIRLSFSAKLIACTLTTIDEEESIVSLPAPF